MGGALGSLFKGDPLSAGGAPTGVPGMVGAVPTGAKAAPNAGEKVFKSALMGGADKFADSQQQPNYSGGSAVLPNGVAPSAVDPGYFSPSSFGGGPMDGGMPFNRQRSPIYGGM